MAEPLRIAVLWTALSGYLNACLRALVDQHSVSLHVTRIQRPGLQRHPYDDKMFAWLPHLQTLPGDNASLATEVLDQLRQFSPDAVVISGWSSPVYRKVARALRQQSIYVIGTADNPWRGTLRQRVGVMIAPWFVRPLFDALWVPGERAANFAKRLGFRGERLLFGLYSADRERFAVVAGRRLMLDNTSWPQRFLFAGRLSPEKGIADLLAAYRAYRSMTPTPWELWVAGVGPLEHVLAEEPGVRLLGFVQPDAYSELLEQVGAFVLPSHYDPWPLVIHEMTSAGLPILCSRQCGSSVELVQDGFNGFTFEAGDVNALARLFSYVSSGQVDLATMSQRSAQLAGRYSPQQWASYLVRHIQRVRASRAEDQ